MREYGELQPIRLLQKKHEIANGPVSSINGRGRGRRGTWSRKRGRKGEKTKDRDRTDMKREEKEMEEGKH